MKIKLDLLQQLGVIGAQILDNERERQLGYPTIRQKIADFIAKQDDPSKWQFLYGEQ